jgi:hypothetical protein
MFLLYHECYVKDFHTTIYSGMLGHHKQQQYKQQQHQTHP